jgi:hypothetical protein
LLLGENVVGKLTSLLLSQTNLLWAGIISAVVSTAVSYFFRKRETRDRLKTEYEYEQRKKLRNLIGLYHGRLLSASNTLNHRFWNLYQNHEKNWLKVNGNYSPQNYYFHSFVHRFLNVCCLVRQFEREAIYVDARIAEKNDFIFLKYLDALRHCVTDKQLFDGLPYDDFYQTDHFFADTFRQYCDSCVDDDGNFCGFDQFVQRVQTDRSIDEVLRFFDSLSYSEKRFRWDRLITFHLVLAGFINSFGYPEQQTTKSQLEYIARQIKNSKVLDNLPIWFARHGLAQDRHTKEIIGCSKRIAHPPKFQTHVSEAIEPA